MGEAPGAKEDELGRPFSGASGILFDEMLGRAGLHREDIFVTNVVHVRPPNNDFSWFTKPKPRAELILGIMQLKKDLEELRPNVVLALGDVPLRFLCNRTGITKWRGSILESTLVRGLKVVPTLHPAGILRVWDNKAVADFDFKRAAEESESPELNLPKRTFYVHPADHIRAQIISEMAKAEWLSADIETSVRPDGSWRISCCGFSDRPDRALTILADRPGAMLEIAALCGCPAKKIFQNGQFDIPVLQDHGIKVANVAWDTMYGHHALLMESAGGNDEVKALSGRKEGARSAFARGLGFQVSIYTREPYYKDDGKLWREV